MKFFFVLVFFSANCCSFKLMGSPLSVFDVYGGGFYGTVKVDGFEKVYPLINQDVHDDGYDLNSGWGYLLGASIHVPILNVDAWGEYINYRVSGEFFDDNISMFLFKNLKNHFLDKKSFYDFRYEFFSLGLKTLGFSEKTLGIRYVFSLKNGSCAFDKNSLYSYENAADVVTVEEWSFQGIGPQIGLELSLPVFKNIYLVSDLKGAFLNENISVVHRESGIDFEGNTRGFSKNLSFSVGFDGKRIFGYSMPYISIKYFSDYLWRNQRVLDLCDTSGVYSNRFLRSEDFVVYGVSGCFGLCF